MEEIIIYCDTETTGLLYPSPTNIDLQEHIIECAFIVMKGKKIIYSFDELIKPPVIIPTHITKITGITNEMVADKPYFKHFANKIKKGFEMADIFVAQNLPFDQGMLSNEFKRAKKKIKFPQPFCTVEQSMPQRGIRLKSTELHKLATGKEKIKGVHRAMQDVKAMVKYYNFIVNSGLPKHMQRG